MAGMIVGGAAPNAQNTPQNGMPSYYYPGTNVPDPKYAAKKAAADTAQQATNAQASADNNAQSSFYDQAGKNVNYSMSYTDPKTGFALNYDPARNPAAGKGAGAGEGASFDEALIKAKENLPPDPRPAVLPERIAPPSRQDFTAANAAMFARAKDRIGMTGQGAMKSLQREMSRRGLGGSGIEGAEMGDIIGGARGQLGDVIRDQTIADVNRHAALDDRDFSALLGQRATDVGFETTTRGQDIQAIGQKASALPQLISLAMRSGTGAIY